MEDLPLPSSPHPLTLAYIDIAEHNDADGEESVEDSSEECIGLIEGASKHTFTKQIFYQNGWKIFFFTFKK